MADYEIVPATTLHVGPLVGALGFQAEQLEARGIRPRRVIRIFLEQSVDCKTCLVGGQVMAMWGFMTASTLSIETSVWLALADAARVHRKVIVREVRRELARALEIFTVIRGSVAVGDARSLRFAQFLGFEVDEGTIIEGTIPYHPTRLVR